MPLPLIRACPSIDGVCSIPGQPPGASCPIARYSTRGCKLSSISPRIPKRISHVPAPPVQEEHALLVALVAVDGLAHAAHPHTRYSPQRLRSSTYTPSTDTRRPPRGRTTILRLPRPTAPDTRRHAASPCGNPGAPPPAEHQPVDDVLPVELVRGYDQIAQSPAGEFRSQSARYRRRRPDPSSLETARIFASARPA